MENTLPSSIPTKTPIVRQATNSKPDAPIKPTPASNTPSSSSKNGALACHKPEDSRSNAITKAQAVMSNAAAKSDNPSSSSIPPSKKAYRIRRKAYRVLNRFKDTPEQNLSQEDKSQIEWAKANVNARSTASSATSLPPQSAAFKRQRSEDQMADMSKRPKISGPKPPRQFSDVAKDSLVWAIIDRNNADGTISFANWKRVLAALAGKFLSVMQENPGPPPRCFDAGWYQGHIKLIACSDQRSADLYKLAIGKIGEIWSGAKLDAVPKDQIPNRPRSKIWVHETLKNPEELLKVIRTSNPDLPTSDWKVVKVSEPVNDLCEALIILNEESLAPLNDRKGQIFVGFEPATLRIYKADNPVKAKNQASASVSMEASEQQIAQVANPLEVDTDSESGVSTSEYVGDYFKSLQVRSDISHDEEESADEAETTVTAINDEDPANKSSSF